MSPLESVDCIFQFFGEDPQFAVVEENTRNICIESSDDFYCVADFSAVKNFIQCFESIYCKNFLRLMSFSVSSRLPSNLQFFHFLLLCRIIS